MYPCALSLGRALQRHISGWEDMWGSHEPQVAAVIPRWDPEPFCTVFLSSPPLWLFPLLPGLSALLVPQEDPHSRAFSPDLPPAVPGPRWLPESAPWSSTSVLSPWLTATPGCSALCLSEALHGYCPEVRPLSIPSVSTPRHQGPPSTKSVSSSCRGLGWSNSYHVPGMMYKVLTLSWVRSLLLSMSVIGRFYDKLCLSKTIWGFIV